MKKARSGSRAVTLQRSPEVCLSENRGMGRGWKFEQVPEESIAYAYFGG